MSYFRVSAGASTSLKSQENFYVIHLIYCCRIFFLPFTILTNMNTESVDRLPPGQQLVAPGKWPIIGEKAPAQIPAKWQLTLSGKVAQPTVLSLEELQSLPQVRRVIDIHCVTRWSKLDVEFAGIELSDLLNLVYPNSSANFISFISHSARRHSTSLTLATALEQKTIIALSVDGEPLSIDHGGPLRNIVPGRYFYKSVKWLTEIELLETDRLGFWEAESGYHNQADPWREQRYLVPNIDKRYAAQLISTKNFNGMDLLSLSASHRDLKDLQAAEAKLRNADFSGSDLRNAVFCRANLSNANLQGANLQGCDFTDADLEGANFTGANLAGAKFTGSSLIGSSFFDPSQGPSSGAHFDDQTEISDDAIAPLFPQQLEFVQNKLAELRS